MKQIILAKPDQHFEENLRLACDWAEPGSMCLVERTEGGMRITQGIHNARITTYSFGDRVLSYRKWQKERQVVPLSDVIEFHWRPDIRRYARESN